MSIIKSKQLLVFLSFISALAMLLMSNFFQGMAYWGEGLSWFWIGVTLSYFIWLIGIIFLIFAITKKTKKRINLSLTYQS